ncbi:unnamed protein product [Scytosiphon promiscuus]
MAPKRRPVLWSAVCVYAWTPSSVGLTTWMTPRHNPTSPSSAYSSSTRSSWGCSRSTRSGAGAHRTRPTRRRSIPVCSLTDLRTVQKENGGVVGDACYEDGHVCEDILLSGFQAGLGVRQRAAAVEEAVQSGAILVDKSHWGIVRVEGEDRLRFLHSQGTNAFEGAKTGQVVPTCFTSNIGRVVDFCEGVVLEDSVWLLSSPHRWQRLLQNMDKFIFPMDKASVSRQEMAVFSLEGVQAAESLAAAKCTSCPQPGCSVEWDFEGEKVLVINHARPMTRREDSKGTGEVVSEGGVPSGGQACLSLMVPLSVASKVWSALAAAPSVVVAGEEEWQVLRIEQGFPFPGKELTSDYNPLEAGLWHTVHFDKGCYIGQESISRVNAYGAVKNALYGVSFEESAAAEEGTALYDEETGKRQVKAGVVTSMLNPEATPRPFGLAYIRIKAGGAGLKVATKEGVTLGTVVQVPYPTRSDAESAMPPAKKEEPAGGDADSAAAALSLEEEKAKEAARKAAKLEAMQKKINALKARRNAA